MYLNGDGVKKDIREALKWFELAAEQNDYEAQYILGELYADESNDFCDLLLAVMWLECAVEGEAQETGNSQEVRKDLEKIRSGMTIDQINKVNQMKKEQVMNKKLM